MKRRRVMHKFFLKEISGVDKMAQGGAKVVLMKRDEDDIVKTMFTEALDGLEFENKVNEALNDQWRLNEALRTSIREIVQDKENYPDTIKSIQESLQDFSIAVVEMITEATDLLDNPAMGKSNKQAKIEGGQEFSASDYAYTPDPKKSSTWKLRLTNKPGGDPDPSIVGAAIAALGPGFRGNKVKIPTDDLPEVINRIKQAWLEANPKKDKEDLPSVLKSINLKGENKMGKTVEELTKNLGEKDGELIKKDEELVKKGEELAKKDEELELAKALGEFTDTEKTHYSSLDDDSKALFVKMDKNGRESELRKIADKNAIVYTSPDGDEYRKSDDPRLIKMAKDRDEDRKTTQEERVIRKNLEFKKQAEADLQYLPGEEETKVTLLKTIDGIEDEEIRKSVLGLLKANNDAMKKAFEKVGHKDGTLLKAEEELHKMANDYSKEHTVTFAKAYSEITKTDRGKELYEQTLA